MVIPDQYGTSVSKDEVPTLKKDLLVSFSGGKTSAYLCWLLLNTEAFKEKYHYHFVFSNTGKENEETLIFADKCDKHFGLNLTWVEAVVNEEKGSGTTCKIVDFKTASRNGEPFEAVIKKYGIPNTAFPHCTRELKERPMHCYMKEKLGHNDYVTAIGIRIDEARRVRPSKKLIYPLTQMGYWVNKHQVADFWKKMPFNLNLEPYQGNCDLCWKKSATKKIQIIRESPEKAKWWSDMEDKYSEGEYFFHRENESTQDLINRSQTSQTRLFDNQELQCTCGEDGSLSGEL